VRNLEDVKRELAQARERRDKIADDLDRLGSGTGQSERRENLSKGLAKADRECDELRDEISEGLAEGIRLGIFSTESAEGPTDRREGMNRGVSDDHLNPQMRASRDAGLRTIERHKDVLSPQASDNLDHIIRNDDPLSLVARYVSAVGDEHYSRAFGIMLAHPMDAHFRMTEREAASVRTVSQVMSERAMAEGTGSAGGYGVPVAIDPTILLSSNGAINPIRQVARVFSISGTNKWTGVSGSVTAAFSAENTEVADGTPTLAQPTVTVQKAQCFVPFSIEVGEDYVGLQAELAKIIADARDVLEAQKFLDGSGTNEPAGILGTLGLAAGQRTQTTTTAVTAVGDIYLLKQALAARWLPTAQFLANPTVVDIFRRFVGGGNTTEPFVVENGEMLRRPTFEWSNMSTGTTTTGQKIVIFGDISAAFAVVDRVGLSVELVPHIMGPTNRFPLGQRGVYAFWRVGSGILVGAAARWLEVK
jgi:HK97 family phage major capsid protein